jgi:hypothetical protein
MQEMQVKSFSTKIATPAKGHCNKEKSFIRYKMKKMTRVRDP